MYRKCKRHCSAGTTRVQPHLQPQTPWSLLAVPTSVTCPLILTKLHGDLHQQPYRAAR